MRGEIEERILGINLQILTIMVLGASDYTRLFLEQRNDFLDVLSAFPSCQPLLPRLIGTHV